MTRKIEGYWNPYIGETVNVDAIVCWRQAQLFHKSAYSWHSRLEHSSRTYCIRAHDTHPHALSTNYIIRYTCLYLMINRVVVRVEYFARLLAPGSGSKRESRLCVVIANTRDHNNSSSFSPPLTHPTPQYSRHREPKRHAREKLYARRSPTSYRNFSESFVDND